MFIAVTSVIWQAFVTSDGVGQAITIFLIVGSAASWGVMLNNTSKMKEIRRRSEEFVKDFNLQTDVLGLYVQNKVRMSDSPMATIYNKTCARFVQMVPQEQLRALRIDPNAPISIPRKRINLVECTCKHVMDEETLKLNEGMGLLALATSGAPLVGLFGTVWGIMLAFNAMAEKGTALISELAPGVSSALLTTVAGLIVAIPSTGFYNKLTSEIEAFTIDIEGFADELSGRIALFYQSED